MPVDAKTIQIFLPDGQPRGVRIAEITTRILNVVVAPRTQLDSVLTRPEIKSPAVYFLFGELEDQAKPVVYIGQTEDLVTRLRSHDSKKEFWKTVVFAISKTGSFTQTHLRFLEWYCIAKAKEAGRYHLNNGNEGSEPYTPEPMKAELLDSYEVAGTLLSALGYPLFEPLVAPQSATRPHEFVFCKGPDADGKGELVDDGFVVFAGSKARQDAVASAPKYLATMQRQLLDQGVIESDGKSFRFAEDFLFDTPSGAATLILARTANGWIEWKSSEGLSLEQLKRPQET